MTHISRPFQIALAAVVLLAGVWFIALRGHTPGGESSGSSSSGSSAAASSPSTPSTSSAGSQSSPGGGAKAAEGKVYHGSAPGVAGLSRAITKAQGAVKASEQNAQQLQQKAAQAAGSNPSRSVAQAQQTQTQQAQQAQTQTAQPQTHSTPAPAVAPTHAKARAVASAPSKQALVEGELKHGRTVIVLFWSPRGSVDVVVRHQLALLHASMTRSARLPQNRNIAVHYSSAREVGRYGTITGSLQVLQTPTMLVISPSGKTKTLTGLVDAYAIRQAIEEARHS